jgi:hypothetical protein
MRDQHSFFIRSSGENFQIRHSLKLGFICGFEIDHWFATLDA